MKKITIVLVLLIIPRLVYAISCDRTTVQNAINAASPGQTISIDAGECTWTSFVTVNVDGLTIQGAGIGSTIIHKFGFQFNHRIDNWRVTGFTFDGDGTNSNGNWSATSQLAISAGNGFLDSGGCKDFRIDNNTFVDYRAGSSSGPGSYTIWVGSYSYGVIDNNTFRDCRGEIIFYNGDGAAGFNRSGLGGYTNGTLFIEDNTFELTATNYGDSGNCADGQNGARICFRYNNITDNLVNDWYDPIEVHGMCSSQRGIYSTEIYENTYTKSNSRWGHFAHFRGGRGVVYNNSVTGYFTQGIFLDNHRSFMSTCAYGGGLCENNEGYPCDYQVNNLYTWSNTDDGGSMTVSVRDAGDTRNHVQQNRDYYLYNASFTGATGVGIGTQAARPATCTTGVAYWDTTNSELDKCTSTNTWTEGWYEPYTYPHPLQGSDTTPPDRWFYWPNGEELSCSEDPKIVNIQLYTDENATCKFSADGDGGDDTNTIYDNLNNTFTTTGGTWHGDPEPVACGSSFSYWVRCMDQSSNKNTTSININGTVADPPEPGAPSGLRIMELKGSTKSMDVGGTTKTFDIQ